MNHKPPQLAVAPLLIVAAALTLLCLLNPDKHVNASLATGGVVLYAIAGSVILGNKDDDDKTP